MQKPSKHDQKTSGEGGDRNLLFPHYYKVNKKALTQIRTRAQSWRVGAH